MTRHSMGVELEVVPQGFSLTQKQKDTIQTIDQLVQSERIPPVEVRPKEDGSLSILPPTESEIAGISSPLYQVVDVEEMA